MSLRFPSQQPPRVYVKCDPAVNRTRHVGSVPARDRWAMSIGLLELISVVGFRYF